MSRVALVYASLLELSRIENLLLRSITAGARSLLASPGDRDDPTGALGDQRCREQETGIDELGIGDAPRATPPAVPAGPGGRNQADWPDIHYRSVCSIGFAL